MDEKVKESTSETETVEAGVRATPKSGESGLPADEAAAQRKRQAKCRDHRSRLQFAHLI